jgi:hypothetical protein
MRSTHPRNPVRAAALAVALGAALLGGCQAHVEDLRPQPISTATRPTEAWKLTVGVTGARSAGPPSSAGLVEGFADFLSNEQIFADVVEPWSPGDGTEDVDLVVHVRAMGEFQPGGMKNFFTWFPGGLALVPNFRGTRWYYDTRAEVEVVDPRSGESLGTYRGETSHVSIHQSSSPGPFLSAAVIVPAVIKGARVSNPKRPYTTMIYAKAYPALWRQITAQMVAQESRYLAATARARPREVVQAPSPEPFAGEAAWAPPARIDDRSLYSRKVAVVIGIDRYASWPRVNGAADDARRVAAHLRATGFDPVIEIYDAEATRERLMNAVGNDLARYVDSNSLALVYFAGHGDTETLPGGSKRGYLIPADGDDDVFATGVSMDSIRDLSNRMAAKHVLYAIDACYSGLSLTRGISIPRATSGYLEKVAGLRAVQILAAGSEGEQAVEVGGQGLFTTYLLRAFSGEADLDGDGAVTAREIGAWIGPQVTAASGARQTPQFGTIEGAGEVIFLTR